MVFMYGINNLLIIKIIGDVWSTRYVNVLMLLYMFYNTIHKIISNDGQFMGS